MVGARSGEAGHPPVGDIPGSTMNPSRLAAVRQLRRVAHQAVRVSIDASDGMRWITIAGTIGLTMAALMAAFGLPPIDLHGPLHRMGIMDPLCGGTRAARLTAQGNLAQAWRYNPLGILATMAGALAGIRVLFGLVIRRWVNIRVSWTSRGTRIALGVCIVLLAALEVRQQGRADLLLRPY